MAESAPNTAHSQNPAIPEKPALEGLEDQVGVRLGVELHLPVRSRRGHGRRSRVRLLRRHSPADRVGQPAHRPRVQLHPHGPRHPLPADARPHHLLPHGLGRQRPAHRASGTELLRRAVRPEPALRRRLHSPASGRRGLQRQGRRPAADLPTQLRRTVRDAHGRGREAVRGSLAPARAQRRLVSDLPHHRRRRPARSPARVPAQPRTRRGVSGERADPVGHHLPHRRCAGRTRRQGTAGRVPPGRVPSHRRPGRHRDRDHPTGAVGRVCGPRRASRRRALQAVLRKHRDDAAVRR